MSGADTGTNGTGPGTLPLVYQHPARAEWGLAILAWQQADRRAYQFEDGALRVFKEGYYNRLEQVDVTAERMAGLIAMLGSSPASSVRPGGETHSSAISLDEQLHHFFAAYPRGFDDPSWRAAHRSRSGSTLKCHREPAIAAARAQLSAAALEPAADPLRGHEVVELIGRVLAGTDLVPKAQLERLAGVRGQPAGNIGLALCGLLWGDAEPLAQRFAAWTAALAAGCRRSPTWELVTAPPALVHPDNHVCVKPSRFHAQAAWMAPSLRFGSTPHPATYVRGLAMVEQIRQQIADRSRVGCAAADLFDVHDFMVFTLSPSASAAILARRRPGAV